MLWCVWLTTGPRKPCCVCGKRQHLECCPRLTRLQQMPFSSAIISNSDCIRQFSTLQNKFHICHTQCHKFIKLIVMSIKMIKIIIMSIKNIITSITMMTTGTDTSLRGVKASTLLRLREGRQDFDQHHHHHHNSHHHHHHHRNHHHHHHHHNHDNIEQGRGSRLLVFSLDKSSTVDHPCMMMMLVTMMMMYDDNDVDDDDDGDHHNDDHVDINTRRRVSPTWSYYYY